MPELIAGTIAAAAGPGWRGDVLDIGCGTGLCGPLLRPIAVSLCGVDLSAGMIEKARPEASMIA